MSDRIRLITFPKPEYGEQIVAVENPDGLHLTLFDACKLFMTNDTWPECLRVQEEARLFAERFVSQMNGDAEKGK